MIQKILCAIGFHKWINHRSAHFAWRNCERCHRYEYTETP